MAPYEDLYGRRCRSPISWFEAGEAKVLGPDLVKAALDTVKLIKQRLLAAQSRQKAYANKRHRELEFSVGDHVFLRVSPMKGVLRCGKKGKLIPRYIGPYEILEKIGAVAYRLALPPELSTVHSVFHVSTLRKYIPDPSHVLKASNIQLDENLTYEEEPVVIIDRKIRKLRSKEIATVKVVWKNHSSEEATWEDDEMMGANSLDYFTGY
ncbi:uncharacterized protein LOC132608377 [Lycium barbarum]|uniref:uncharacterized protein LOC132608377 n=1 Tax=Lycium barbarum TaxID=112863 RepID=UPI00293F4397|nr:uncharacterized protein LOC132608377 [Lycium barbarum]